jgi:hypothetical protein
VMGFGLWCWGRRGWYKRAGDSGSFSRLEIDSCIVVYKE